MKYPTEALIDKAKHCDSETLKDLYVREVNWLAEHGHLFTITEAQAILGMSSNQAVSYATRAKNAPLDALQVGRTWYFTRKWLDDYLAAHAR